MQEHAPPRRLTRSADRKIGGVCGGIAEYFGVDPTIVRIGFIVLAIVTIGPGGLLAYGILWAIMPAPDPNAPASNAPPVNGALLLGIILVVIGVAAAFQGLQFLWWMTSGIMRVGWPVALIAAGVVIVLAARRGNQ